MSGLNKVERFIQNRNRPNLLVHQHQTAPGPPPEQALRRSTIAANARIQTPVTKLQSLPAPSRVKQTSIENASLSPALDGRPNEPRRAHTETADSRTGHRDIFDTDVEDLTESLLSDKISPEDGLGKEPWKNEKGEEARHDSTSRPGETYWNRSSERQPQEPDLSSDMGDATSDIHHETDDPDDSSDASDDMRPGDDPTVTFTPEQAARVQDFSRRALEVVERPKSASHQAVLDDGARPGPRNNLYDVTSPKNFQKDDRRSSRLFVKSSTAVPYQNQFHSSTNAKRTAPYRDRIHNHSAYNNDNGQRSAFEPNEVSDEEHQAEQAPLKSASQEPPNLPPPQQPSPSSPIDAALSTVAAAQLDYPPDILAGMSYSDLLSQPFDSNPNPPPSILPPNHMHSPLPSQLAYVLNLPSTTQQGQYFASLTAAQWEDCGEWFVDQFASLSARITQARRHKRNVALAFEREIAARESFLRAKTDGFDAVLEGMKRSGQGLLGRDRSTV